jgi:very-short-patch-repair endonuclease/energy-coupling factor transporter ATP-binding protein EcfA2
MGESPTVTTPPFGRGVSLYFSSATKRVLSNSKTGMSAATLSDALGLAGDLVGRRELHNDLAEWARQGLVLRQRDGRWIWVQREAPLSDIPYFDATFESVAIGGSTEKARRIFAVPARSFVIQEPKEDLQIGDISNEEGAAEPDIRALLSYYAAGLRTDTRGSVFQLPERHGESWQLIEVMGAWWPERGETATLEIRLDILSGEFRQALDRRGDDNSIAVGWPISIGRDKGLEVVQPVGLLAGEFERVDDRLLISLSRTDTLVNPAWLNLEAGRAKWGKDSLRERLSGPNTLPKTLSEFGWALREATATLVDGNLEPGRLRESFDLDNAKIQNCAALFLPEDLTMSKAAAGDLEAVRNWSDDQIYSSALAPLLAPSRATAQPRLGHVLETKALNEEQLEAVDAGLSSLLTVVTGPPGTGKSQCVTALVASTVAAGGRVLVAAKNHQALDAIEERIGRDRIIRMRDRSGETDRSLASVAREFIADERAQQNVEPVHAEIQALNALSERRATSLDRIREKREIECEIAALLERIDAIEQSVPTTLVKLEVVKGLLDRLIIWLAFFLRRKRAIGAGPRSDTVSLKARLRELRQKSSRVPQAEDPVLLSDMIREKAAPLLSRIFEFRFAVGSEKVADLSDAMDDAELHGQSSLSDDVISAVLDARPVWLTTTLSLPRRMPLRSGLFDLLVIDEASQADIGSSLPALARAKRAVIVGDDRQLTFIPSLSLARDRNLFAAVGLGGQRGLGKYSQGRRTVFDLAIAQAVRDQDMRSVMLREQYRSAPEITEFIGTSFYGGALRPAVDPEQLIVPVGTKPGLTWTDVKGSAERGSDKGFRNRAEAQAICDHLEELMLKQNYPGTVGIIAPFNAQVRTLRQLIEERIPTETRDRAQLKIDTVDSFQGEERNLIIFSVVSSRAGPSEAERFLRSDRRRLNVAISRAQAVTHIFGDLDHAKRKDAPSDLRRLAIWATEPKERAADKEAGSLWEIRLREAMKSRGWDPKPQYPIVGRRLDFALFREGVKLDIEVDGRRWHQDANGNRKLDDHYRDAQLRSAGWKVVRFWVDELARDMEGCLDRIERELR